MIRRNYLNKVKRNVIEHIENVQKELEAINNKKNEEAISYDIFSDEEVIDNE